MFEDLDISHAAALQNRDMHLRLLHPNISTSRVDDTNSLNKSGCTIFSVVVGLPKLRGCPSAHEDFDSKSQGGRGGPQLSTQQQKPGFRFKSPLLENPQAKGAPASG